MEVSKNSRIYEYIERIAAKNTIPHAILISGNDDEKNKIASLLARVILCTGKERPCNACNSCHKVTSGIHPDLVSFKTEKTMILVDEIREIRRDSFVLPNDGEKKVYIIEESDKMNAQAQNAFLKILEEPPKFTTFILLCTNENSLLTTVLSRVTHLKLQSNADYEDVAEELKALSRAIAQAISTRDELSLLKEFMACEKRKRDEMAGVCAYLMAILRDAAVYDTLPNDLFANDGTSREINAKLSVNEILEIMKIIDEARKLIARNVGVSHVVAMCAAKIACSLK